MTSPRWSPPAMAFPGWTANAPQGEESDLVESGIEHFLGEQLEGSCDRNGHQRPNNAEQRTPDEDGDHRDQRRHPHHAADDSRYQQIVLAEPKRDEKHER